MNDCGVESPARNLPSHFYFVSPSLPEIVHNKNEFLKGFPNIRKDALEMPMTVPFLPIVEVIYGFETIASVKNSLLYTKILSILCSLLHDVFSS